MTLLASPQSGAWRGARRLTTPSERPWNWPTNTSFAPEEAWQMGAGDERNPQRQATNEVETAAGRSTGNNTEARNPTTAKHRGRRKHWPAMGKDQDRQRPQRDNKNIYHSKGALLLAKHKLRYNQSCSSMLSMHRRPLSSAQTGARGSQEANRSQHAHGRARR